MRSFNSSGEAADRNIHDGKSCVESVTRCYKGLVERGHLWDGISKGFMKEAVADVVFEGQKILL